MFFLFMGSNSTIHKRYIKKYLVKSNTNTERNEEHCGVWLRRESMIRSIHSANFYLYNITA